MTRQRQKSEELRLVEQMRKALGGLPAGQINSCDSPDVCVMSGARRIGIEVTELHQTSRPDRSPRRLQESERAGIVARARLLAEASGMPVVDVAVHFNESVPIAKHDRDQLTRGLVTLVQSHVPNDETSVSLDLWRHPTIALPWVRTVRVFRSGLLTRHHWAVPDSGWVQIEFSSELQTIITEKNARHAEYRQRCDECWLLIVASGGRVSGLFQPNESTRTHVYRSLFARTFFMEAFTGSLIELSTRAA